jgi:hypothetical protein
MTPRWPPKPSDFSDEPTQAKPFQFSQGRLTHRATGLFLSKHHHRHISAHTGADLFHQLLVKIQFAIDPTVNATRYPKNEQEK